MHKYHVLDECGWLLDENVQLSRAIATIRENSIKGGKMNMIKIDIKTELAAIEQGQCPHCRVGTTHQPTERCYNFRDNYVPMKYCGSCNHMYSARFTRCPVCQRTD